MLKKMKKSQAGKTVNGTLPTRVEAPTLWLNAHEQRCREVAQLFNDMEESRNDRISETLADFIKSKQTTSQ